MSLLSSVPWPHGPKDIRSHITWTRRKFARGLQVFEPRNWEEDQDNFVNNSEDVSVSSGDGSSMPTLMSCGSSTLSNDSSYQDDGEYDDDNSFHDAEGYITNEEDPEQNVTVRDDEQTDNKKEETGPTGVHFEENINGNDMDNTGPTGVEEQSKDKTEEAPPSKGEVVSRPEPTSSQRQVYRLRPRWEIS
eukprot:14158582-Ditylum_brightwellii.AAC.1